MIEPFEAAPPRCRIPTAGRISPIDFADTQGATLHESWVIRAFQLDTWAVSDSRGSMVKEIPLQRA